jgi:hypothetical protein
VKVPFGHLARVRYASWVLFSLSLAAVIAAIVLEWIFAFRMAREVALYASGALRDRSANARHFGRLAGSVVGFVLWLPLLIFNALVFRTPWPVTRGRMEPRRI